MTGGGIILNNALSNFYTPSASGASSTANTLVEGNRPLTQNVVALAMDTRDICGSRYLFGGASADAVGQVMAETLLDEDEDLRTAVDSARLLYRNETYFLEFAIDSNHQEIR